MRSAQQQESGRNQRPHRPVWPPQQFGIARAVTGEAEEVAPGAGESGAGKAFPHSMIRTLDRPDDVGRLERANVHCTATRCGQRSNQLRMYSCVRRKLDGVDDVPCHSLLNRIIAVGTFRNLSAS